MLALLSGHACARVRCVACVWFSRPGPLETNRGPRARPLARRHALTSLAPFTVQTCRTASRADDRWSTKLNVLPSQRRPDSGASPAVSRPAPPPRLTLKASQHCTFCGVALVALPSSPACPVPHAQALLSITRRHHIWLLAHAGGSPAQRRARRSSCAAPPQTCPVQHPPSPCAGFSSDLGPARRVAFWCKAVEALLCDALRSLLLPVDATKRARSGAHPQ